MPSFPKCLPSSFFYLFSTISIDFCLQACGLNGSGMEKLLKKGWMVVERKKSVPLPAFFWSVPFHYWTVQRFQKVSLEYCSASFLT